jgi:hypothetical protein
LVFATRHGEFGRTLAILHDLAQDHGVSPAEFTFSVYHALAGLLSIALKNGNGHTTISAGTESFFCGLLEAATSLAEEPAKPVGLVYFDEPLSGAYEHFAPPGAETIALALILERDGSGPQIRLSCTAAPDGVTAAPRPAEAFLAFLLENDIRTIVMGERLAWQLERINASH